MNYFSFYPPSDGGYAEFYPLLSPRLAGVRERARYLPIALTFFRHRSIPSKAGRALSSYSTMYHSVLP